MAAQNNFLTPYKKGGTDKKRPPPRGNDSRGAGGEPGKEPFFNPRGKIHFSGKEQPFQGKNRGEREKMTFQNPRRATQTGRAGVTVPPKLTPCQNGTQEGQGGADDRAGDINYTPRPKAGGGLCELL